MSNLGQDEPLVRFWALNHYRPETLSLPTSDWAMLAHAGRGSLLVQAADRRWVLPPFRAMFVPAGTPVTLTTVCRAEVRSLFFAPGTPLDGPARLIEVLPLLRELILYACEQGPLWAHDPRHAAIAQCLLQEVQAAPALPTDLPWPKSQRLRDLAERLYAGTEPVADCLKTFGYSRRTLERAMERETHLPLGRWLRRARMLRALTRLGEGDSVAEASEAAGYSAPSAFIQAFSREFGITPAKIRGPRAP